MESEITRIILTGDQIRARVRELGAQITADYAGREVTLVGVLRGAIVFLVDLLREIELPVRIDLIAISSYNHGTETSGVVRLTKDLDESIEGLDVLVVEDIVDTGLTLQYLRDNLSTRNPRSLRVCALLDKPSRRRVAATPDYVGFTIPDEFVVGYGLDYAQLYRGLPYVGALGLPSGSMADRQPADNVV